MITPGGKSWGGLLKLSLVGATLPGGIIRRWLPPWRKKGGLTLPHRSVLLV